MLLDDGAECWGKDPVCLAWAHCQAGCELVWVFGSTGSAGVLHLCAAPPCHWVEPPADVFWDGERAWTDDELLLELAVREMERLYKGDE